MRMTITFYHPHAGAAVLLMNVAVVLSWGTEQEQQHHFDWLFFLWRTIQSSIQVHAYAPLRINTRDNPPQDHWIAVRPVSRGNRPSLICWRLSGSSHFTRLPLMFNWPHYVINLANLPLAPQAWLWHSSTKKTQKTPKVILSAKVQCQRQGCPSHFTWKFSFSNEIGLIGKTALFSHDYLSLVNCSQLQYSVQLLICSNSIYKEFSIRK